MIDEELYQQATDELNSDRRRAHLWARACALSSDDHDEARYLYTNLRVEELIAERERAGPAAPVPASATDDGLDGLELEPIGLDGADGSDGAALDDTVPDAPFAGAPSADASFADVSLADAPGVLDAGASVAASPGLAPDAPPAPAAESPAASPIEPPRAVRAGGAMPDASDGAAGVGLDGDEVAAARGPDADPDSGPNAGPDAGPDAAADAGPGAFPDASLAPGAAYRPESVRDRMQLELDEDAVDLDADEIVRLNEARPEPVRSIEMTGGARGPSGGPSPDGADAGGGSGGTGGADAARGSAPPTPRAHAGGHPRRDDADAQLDAIIDAGGTGGTGGTGGASVAARRAFGSRVRGDYADARDLDALLDDPHRPHARPGGGGEHDTLELVEDDSGPGRRWSVLEAEDGELAAVKRGACWPALFVTLPWLLARGLWGTAIVYALLWVACALGIAMTGFAWLDAGPAVSDGTVFAFAGFVAIALAGLVLAPLLRANRWRTRRLVRRGWELAGELRARSPADAVSRFRELDAGRP